MEETLKERFEAAANDFEKDQYKNKNNIIGPLAKEMFKKGVEAGFNMALPQWVPISEYPKEGSPKVLRWHHVWKCYVTVSHRRERTSQSCEWIDGTLSNTWSEAAFTPYFIIPTPPNPKD